MKINKKAIRKRAREASECILYCFDPLSDQDQADAAAYLAAHIEECIGEFVIIGKKRKVARRKKGKR